MSVCHSNVADDEQFQKNSY